MTALARVLLLLTVACSSKREPEAKTEARAADPWSSSSRATPAQPTQADPWSAGSAAQPTHADPWGKAAAEESPAAPAAAPQAPAPAAPAAAPLDGPLVNTWASGRSNWTQTNVQLGSFKYLYRFAADGTYVFHSESHTLTQGSKWYVVDERGVVEVAGDRVTLRPTAGAAATKNRDGAVLETPAWSLQPVTYQWQLHFFDGLNENQLVLTPIEPAGMTTRDGSFAVNDQFPSSYLLSTSYRPEWKFAW